MSKEIIELSSRQRFWLSLLAAAALPFSVAIFGAGEIYLNNSDEFLFVLSDFWFVAIALGLATFAAFFVLLRILKGKVFHVILSLLVWLALMSYVQGNFLNFGLTSLGADELAAGAGIGLIVLDLSIWLITGVGFVCAALLLKDKQTLGLLATVALIMIFAVQTVNFSIAFLNSDEPEKSEKVLTTENLFEVSQGDNVIVFILDRFDIYYYHQTLKQEPDFFKALDGFTIYDNNISLYSRTYPSITYMLTGQENRFTSTREEYFKEAYADSVFLKDLKANGYKINLYTSAYYAYDDAAVFGDLVDNVSHYDDYVIEGRMGLTAKMLALSLYRYLPLGVKDLIGVSSADFDKYVSFDTQNDHEKYVMSDADTYRLFRENGLTTQNESNTFTFLHLNGCHSPYTMDENGNPIESNNYASAAIPALKGCFGLIYDHIAQLKALGLYEDATIIITGDHARAMDDTVDVEDARVTALFVKQSGDYGTPLAYSSAPVCQENLRAEIVKSAGIKTDENYGRAFSDIGENEEIVRKYYFEKSNGDKDEIVKYRVVGNANDFSSWTLYEKEVVGEIYK
ncbi:MAG: sulfatase-like hydrolase/transferase [Clostridia bacterium]|nr:sulfatase-like hydrolase/transferase [Clostridia bacterium]